MAIQIRNRKVLLALIFLGLILLALYPPVSEKTRGKFQQQSVSATVLEYGETGKILKNIGAMYPIENQQKEFAYHQNVLDVIDRAKRDRKKWLQISPYRQYRATGMFCYFEMQSTEDQVPFIVSQRKQDEWKAIESFSLSAGREVYPFFLDIEKEQFKLDFYFRNKFEDIKVRTIVFLKPGYQPIVYYDPLSYLNFLDEVERTNYAVESDSFRILPNKKGTHYKVSLSFKKNGLPGISKFQKKEGRTRVQNTTRANHPLLSQQVLSGESLLDMSLEGLPVLAIDVQEEDLLSEEYGILKNFNGHGREWERLAHVRFHRDGKMVLDTFSGLRLQGGEPSRKQGLLNFRILFRDEYGESFIESKLVFPETTGTIKRLAIKKSDWEEWPLNSPIAYDIARQVGALAPPTELVRFYLNGDEKGLYYLVPHLGEKQVELMFPDKDLLYYRYRGTHHDADQHFLLEDFWFRFSKAETINEEFADQFFDLDNQLAHLFSIIFNGTGDFCQGLILKDTAPDSKMFWYMWDVDHSFINLNADIHSKSSSFERWEKEPSVGTFFQIVEKVGEDCPRVYLFKMLINEDQQFRKKALASLIAVLNHRLPDTYLIDLLWKYWSKLESVQYPHRQAYIERLSTFFRHRKSFLVEEINALGTTSPLTLCEITSPHYPFRVDNYQKTGNYTGYHFTDQPLEILVEDVPENTTIYINDQAIDSNPYLYPVSSDQDCRVRIETHANG